jgi:hypothetical protein
VTLPVQELLTGAVTNAAPKSDTYDELLTFAVIAEGAVKVTTIGAEFACPAVSGPVLVTVKLVIGAAWEEDELNTVIGRAAPIARANAKRGERDREKD